MYKSAIEVFSKLLEDFAKLFFATYCMIDLLKATEYYLEIGVSIWSKVTGSQSLFVGIYVQS